MSGAPFPYRPRLADHAMPRRHVVDGVERVVIHDARSGDLIQMEPRGWEILAACDGTREFDGIALAATRAGAYLRESDLRGVLEALHAAGLLADGIAPPPPAAPPPARPLDVLPDFALVCDESGVCCGFYSSIIFSPLEAARARSIRPEVLGAGAREDRAFLPAFGADRAALAVAEVDGRCAYLSEGGRCSLHVAGGEDAKPRGCRSYPASFMDDGESVRVSVGVECPCVLASASRRALTERRALLGAGAPLVPPGARTLSDLDPGARIATLPERVVIRAGVTAPRGDFIAWSRAVAAAGMPRDAVAALWALADAVEAGGLDAVAAAAALEGGAAPAGADAEREAAEEILPWIEALARRARARLESAAAWRSPRDRARAASAWIADAAGALASAAALATALGGAFGGGRLAALAGRAPPGADPEAEAFYVRAALHGHHLVDEIPIALALRDRAARILVGRALGAVLAREAPDDPARAYPLTLVEAMMRAHGLKAYAREVVPRDASRGK